MKHLVMRAYSTIKKNFFYGAPGLGDRIHHIMLCYNYSLVENTPVTLHLTKYQWNRHKPDSWPEIMSLFPEGKVFIEKHLDHEPKDNKSFLEFVKNKIAILQRFLGVVFITLGFVLLSQIIF